MTLVTLVTVKCRCFLKGLRLYFAAALSKGQGDTVLTGGFGNR
jgi:hypothetical protein